MQALDTRPATRRPAPDRPILTAARAAALFTSTVDPSDNPRDDTIRVTVQAVIHAQGLRGCHAFVAAEYGEHPETAHPRMTWALAAVRRAFAGQGPR